jgi:hypothetical protein
MHILAFLFLIVWVCGAVADSRYRRRQLAEFHRAMREEAEAHELKWRRAKAFVALWRQRSAQNGRASWWTDEIAEEKAIKLLEMEERLWCVWGASYYSDGLVYEDSPSKEDRAALVARVA